MGAQVSREPPPPLPGCYTVGEQVYYTGTSETLESGDRVEHGKQGEVVGPATSENHKGKGVAVFFPDLPWGPRAAPAPVPAHQRTSIHGHPAHKARRLMAD